ncbi:MAG: hypothetical protein H0V30_06870 [Chitinophagaceae bacterium]|jgi:hypothetical protein|nr:hypothetical protein [Chitinophagaceae bacterium]
MHLSRLLVLLLPALFLFGSCNEKKKSLSGDEPLEAGEFITSFNEIDLPYSVADTTLNKKDNDSSLISYKIFTQFVPDTIVTRIMGKGTPKLYQVGKITVDEDEIYVVTKAVLNKKRAIILTAFNENDQFLQAMPLIVVDELTGTRQSSTINEKYTINKTVLRRDSENNLKEGKEVYVYNKEGKNFMLIMTESMEDGQAELLNPLDTLPRENKYSGDYVKDKKNIVSIRDATRDERFQFFIHFEKNKGECTGELKGFALFTAPTTAVYRQPGDPCVLQFVFSKNSVTLQEMEGCGNRRGLKCSFDGSYSLKKQTSSKKIVKGN